MDNTMDISEDELRKWTVPTLRNFLRSKGIPSSLVVIQLENFGFGIEEGPTLAAGFTLSTPHLCQRLDCLLHSVTCEMPDQETSQECFRKHCSIMKTSLVHMSSCSEFTSCSNVICLLFSPLLSHWKGCCGPCSICGPINVKYNKKKILSKIHPNIVTSDGKLINVAFEEYEKIDDWRIRAIPYHLREYMMADKSSHSAVVQQYLSKKAEGIGCFSSGLTWNQLPGIDFDLNKLVRK